MRFEKISSQPPIEQKEEPQTDSTDVGAVEEAEKIEREKFRERWYNLFSPEETKRLVRKHIIGASPYAKKDIALFRASDEWVEKFPPKIRSWSRGFTAVLCYIQYRQLRNLEEQLENKKVRYYDPNEEIERLPCIPVIKIVKGKNIPEEAVQKGLEAGEIEIDEKQLNPDEILTITKLSEAQELKNIFLEHFQPNSKNYKQTEGVLEAFIKKLNRVEEVKRLIEERDY